MIRCTSPVGAAPRNQRMSFPSSFSAVISSKERVNPPSFYFLFRSCYEITSKGTIASSFLAGRFSVVTGSGSWRSLHVRAWGSVRLFLFLDTASCAGSLIHRGRHAPVRSSIHASFIYCRNFKYPAGVLRPYSADVSDDIFVLLDEE